MNTKNEKKTTNEKPVSIPLDFREALGGLLKVKPKDKPKKKPRTKQTKKSSD